MYEEVDEEEEEKKKKKNVSETEKNNEDQSSSIPDHWWSQGFRGDSSRYWAVWHMILPYLNLKDYARTVALVFKDKPQYFPPRAQVRTFHDMDSALSKFKRDIRRHLPDLHISYTTTGLRTFIDTDFEFDVGLVIEVEHCRGVKRPGFLPYIWTVVSEWFERYGPTIRLSETMEIITMSMNRRIQVSDATCSDMTLEHAVTDGMPGRSYRRTTAVVWLLVPKEAQRTTSPTLTAMYRVCAKSRGWKFTPYPPLT